MTDTLWKTCSVTLIGILVTGLTSWFAFGANTVRQDELRQEVANQLSVAIAEQRRREDAQLQVLSIDFAKLSTKLDFVLDELKDIKKRVDKEGPNVSTVR